MSDSTIETVEGKLETQPIPAEIRMFPFCHPIGKRKMGTFRYILNGCPRGATAAVAYATELHADGSPHAGDAPVATLSVTYNAKEGVLKVLLDSSWPHSQIHVGIMGAFLW